MPHTCSAVRKDGSPCTARCLPGREHCFAHDPALADHRRAANAEGGTNRATVRRLERRVPQSLRPVLESLYRALQAVEAGCMEPKQGQAMASIASALVRVYETAQLEVTLEETQARLAALERGQQA